MKDIFQLRLRKSVLLLLLFRITTFQSYSQDIYWQQQVSYLIDVSLNDKDHSLDGFEKITYINHSPDTLTFIWFHIWPNAFKNDQTAFSEQLLINGRTDFYFANKAQRGYINRLDFKVDGITAVMEDHPEHTDIIKLILPGPLAPGASLLITTPFHVQLPENFSRGGHKGQSYQVTQWYPKPAVYDRKGWHPMPYLDQGEFYSEFGNYDVRITLPSNYIVAATGMLQGYEEKAWLKNQKPDWAAPVQSISKKIKKPVKDSFPASSASTKTLQYVQDNAIDFAWFADKRFVVQSDTLKLPGGKIIDVFSFHLPGSLSWKNSLAYIRQAAITRSAWIGEYPYGVMTAVEAGMGVAGGMEYPTITSISSIASEKENDLIIAHEVGHNWFQAIIATNERRFPWMDEGMNSYYDNRYEELKYQENVIRKPTFQTKRFPPALDNLVFETMARMEIDQPINTSSEKFSEINYALVNYHKAALWMKKLEALLGKPLFDSCMKEYYLRWKFKHPYPEDFQAIITAHAGNRATSLFNELDKKGSLQAPVKKSLKLTSYFNLKDTDKFQYISLAPALGYNMYDALQVGALVHNYQLPLPSFRFLLAPMYGTGSKQLNGLARASYSWMPHSNIHQVEAGAALAAFTMDDFDVVGFDKKFLRFRKFAPFIRLTFKEAPLSASKKSLQLKWFFINEDGLDFKQVINGQDTVDVINVIRQGSSLGELKYVVTNTRALYPYEAGLQVQYHKNFIRASITGNYFYNYSSGKGGIKVRWFAGKFFYPGTRNIYKSFETDRYHFNLTGARGYEDYTYSNYFIGRNKFKGIGSQQLMIRDGGFKVGTDLLDAKVGKTDDWLGALNFAIHIPDLSDKLPVKIFFDIGTYAEAWQKNAEGSRFLYDAGLQLSFFKQTVNVYVPVFYSSIYKNYFRSTLGEQRFLKTISFSIDLQDINLKKINKELVF